MRTAPYRQTLSFSWHWAYGLGGLIGDRLPYRDDHLTETGCSFSQPPLRPRAAEASR
ncbi:hypothetical protein CT19431_MP30115 [Cupriavidus taiwanensis]|nr:hypothetical protein CT19431_MP30115 [Cupriavidus taiwanensis]